MKLAIRWQSGEILGRQTSALRDLCNRDRTRCATLPARHHTATALDLGQHFEAALWVFDRLNICIGEAIGVALLHPRRGCGDRNSGAGLIRQRIAERVAQCLAVDGAQDAKFIDVGILAPIIGEAFTFGLGHIREGRILIYKLAFDTTCELTLIL
ncbi:hypothetical protein A1351_08580 [Methylosinus sp. R-45379]|nr:hypothetical protein A1351_08580 [Methylosinus sp. R-45379]